MIIFLLTIALLLVGFIVVMLLKDWPNMRLDPEVPPMPRRSLWRSDWKVGVVRITYDTPCSGISCGGWASPHALQINKQLQITVRRRGWLFNVNIDRRIK